MKVKFSELYGGVLLFIFEDGAEVRNILEVSYTPSGMTKGLHFYYYSEIWSNNQYYHLVDNNAKIGIERLKKYGIEFKNPRK